MKTSREIAWEANRIRKELCENHPHLAAKLLPIRFEVSGRMTRAAGTAYPKRNLIKLSLAFFADEGNFAKEFRNTVTHEIAHILVPPTQWCGRSNRDAHGFNWQMMHRSIGGDGKRCHELELSAGFQARKKVRFELPCFKCGRPILLTRSRAEVYRLGIARGSMGPGTGYGFSHGACPPGSVPVPRREETPLDLMRKILGGG